jgi:RNA 2',3'-cyclic 3'-phosphodiesterase
VTLEPRSRPEPRPEPPPEPPPERVRLFVALELPDEVRGALVGWRSGAVHALDGVRLLPPDRLHVTLCFLGSRSQHEVEPIAAACRVLVGASVRELRLGEAVWLPRRRPRALAVSIADPLGSLAAAQTALAAALVEGGWYAPEERQFFGHATVARIGRGTRVPSELLVPTPTLAFAPRRVTLYRSRLQRAGARYEALASVELSG